MSMGLTSKLPKGWERYIGFYLKGKLGQLISKHCIIWHTCLSQCLSESWRAGKEKNTG